MKSTRIRISVNQICIRGILLVTFILVHCLGVKLHDDPVHVNKPPYMQMQACTPLATPLFINRPAMFSHAHSLKQERERALK